jgi:hypothetical protein
MIQAMHHSGTARLQLLRGRSVDQGMEILRPFMLLACVAFTVGFIGYWALVGVVAPSDSQQWTLAPADAPAAQVISPVIQPDLASAKHI